MTKIKAFDTMHELGAKDTVFKILDMLNGETYSDAKTILDIAAFYLKEHTYLDADMAKSLINDTNSNDE